jgi:uncharacterized membrane protein YgaE (UPF0421/DUF939 family)
MAGRLKQPLSWLGYPALQAAKTALAAGLSWFIAADVLGNSIPVFAPLAALLTVQVTVWESVSRGLQRVLGVVVGVLVAFGFARLAGIHAWSIALVVFVSILAGQLLRLGQQGSVQVPVSALLVLVLGAATSGYALDRVVDTALGAGVGIAINLVVVPPTHLDEARAKVGDFAGAMAELLCAMATELGQPGTERGALLARARRLSVEANDAALAVARTATAVRWNPAGRRDRSVVDRLVAATKALNLVERPVRGIARTLADAQAGWRPPADLVTPLAQLLVGVADELRSWVTQAVAGGDGPPGPAATGEVGAGPGGGGGGGRTTDDLYHRAIIAARRADVVPETAAVASAVALDAQRISSELRESTAEPAAGRFDWRSLLT